jgi:hypothetical protein
MFSPPRRRIRRSPAIAGQPHLLGLLGRLEPDRVVDGHEFGPVGEGRFHLHRVDHLGDAVHHVLLGEQGLCRRANLGDAHPLAGAFAGPVRDERDGLGVVQLHAAFPAASCELCGHEDRQSFAFFGCEFHV